MKNKSFIKKIIYSLLNLYHKPDQGKATGRPETNTFKASKSFYDFSMVDIDGKQVDFKMFKGKKILIVNTASKCGYTGQYAGLEKLSQLYKSKLFVLGFPSNDFGKQEPGSNNEIKEFCESQFNVTFPLFAKIKVSGNDQHPLYQWLSTSTLNGWNDQAPEWNFCKYLVDEKGELIYFYSEKVKPMSERITKQIYTV
jgi:glutathione peroxidase